ncbi:unnamed protein product, partial [Gongylonema pulchrum]|uniref:Uncharacterized protein n=1 Tax=Gongylonema pulchrum TaxID=637853 RepID=A0A183DJG1_9BILA
MWAFFSYMYAGTMNGSESNACCRKRSSSFDRDMINQLQNELRIAKLKWKQLRDLLKDYKIYRKMIRWQVREMESRIVENQNATVDLMLRKQEADAAAALWSQQLVKLLDAANSSCPEA